MKRIALMVLVLILAISAAAWAGERSSLISEQELNEIEVIAQGAFAPDTQFQMEVGDDINGNYASINFFQDDILLLQIEVYPVEATAIVSDSDIIESKKIAEIAEKIILGIEVILNRSPQDERVMQKILS